MCTILSYFPWGINENIILFMYYIKALTYTNCILYLYFKRLFCTWNNITLCTNESTVFDSAIRTVQPHYGFYSVLVCLIYYTYECLRMFISYFYCELHYTYIKDSNCVQSSRISPEALTKTSFYFLCIILRLWHTPTVFCTYIIQGFFCTYNNIVH